MTDRGEGELRKWALKRNGAPASNEDIVSLIFAFADDFEVAHADTLEFFRESRADRDDIRARVICLEEWREQSETSCKERVNKLIAVEHEKRHGEHMEKYHPLEKERLSWLVDATAVRLSSVFWFVVGALLISIVSYLVWGTP